LLFLLEKTGQLEVFLPRPKLAGREPHLLSSFFFSPLSVCFISKNNYGISSFEIVAIKEEEEEEDVRIKCHSSQIIRVKDISTI
jgi:hypothetical protein